MTIGKCLQCGFENFITESKCRQCDSELDDVDGKSLSFFGRLRDAVTKRGLKREQAEELRRLLRTVVGDGVVSDTEIQKLRDFYKDTDLSQKDFADVRDEIFAWYADLILRDRRVTPEEKNKLFHVANRLGVGNEALEVVNQSARYFELLHAIESSSFDYLPAARSSSVLLKSGEIDYFTAAGSLLEERVVNRQIVGRSSGVSFRVMKGVSFRVGQSRGRIVSETGIVPISQGELTITNRRLVFSGDRKSVNAEFSKLLDVEMFSDGLRFSLTNRQKPVTVLLADPRCSEVFGLYISRIYNQ